MDDTDALIEDFDHDGAATCIRDAMDDLLDDILGPIARMDLVDDGTASVDRLVVDPPAPANALFTDDEIRAHCQSPAVLTELVGASMEDQHTAEPTALLDVDCSAPDCLATATLVGTNPTAKVDPGHAVVTPPAIEYFSFQTKGIDLGCHTGAGVTAQHH